MHQPYVTTAPPPPLHLWGWVGDSGANVRGSVTQIYPSRIYYYKEQGYDSQQVLAVQGP